MTTIMSNWLSANSDKVLQCPNCKKENLCKMIVGVVKGIESKELIWVDNGHYKIDCVCGTITELHMYQKEK